MAMMIKENNNVKSIYKEVLNELLYETCAIFLYDYSRDISTDHRIKRYVGSWEICPKPSILNMAWLDDTEKFWLN